MTNAFNASRFAKLYAAMDLAELESVALVPGANFYYLTGVHFGLYERPTLLIVNRSGNHQAIIPVLEKTRWLASAPDVESFFWQDSDGFDDAFSSLAKRSAVSRMGVEGQRMRVFEFQSLSRHFTAAAITDAQAAISSIRLHKDDEAVACIARAIEISEIAIGRTIQQVCIGQTEAQVKSILLKELFSAGAEGLAFNPIVLTGSASADPHGTSSPERILEKGHPLLFDFGAAWGGYNADITRTFFVGSVSEDHRAVYNAVLAANKLGRELAKPGTTLHTLDVETTECMQKLGFADLVVHKLGHGLGLDGHELPQVMKGNMEVLEPGMVFTIEPGLYRDGDIGVRIEDNFLITDVGGRSLTSFPRDLTII